VWLASISLWDRRDKQIGTDKWTERQWRHAHKLADQALEDAGEPSRERRFRMRGTLCVHRAIRPDELGQIPSWWHAADAIDIAGGPIEVLSERGIAHVESAQPCHNHGRHVINPRRPDLYVPVDCGECPPCRARQAVRTRGPLLSSGHPLPT